MDIELNPVESSNIAAVGYDEASRTMRVEFKNGSQYDYPDVDQVLVDEFLDADSVGRYFQQNIRNSFQGLKVDQRTEEERIADEEAAAAREVTGLEKGDLD